MFGESLLSLLLQFILNTYVLRFLQNVTILDLQIVGGINWNNQQNVTILSINWKWNWNNGAFAKRRVSFSKNPRASLLSVENQNWNWLLIHLVVDFISVCFWQQQNHRNSNWNFPLSASQEVRIYKISALIIFQGRFLSNEGSKNAVLTPKGALNRSETTCQLYFLGKSLLLKWQDPLFTMKGREYSKRKRETSQSVQRRTESVLLIQLTEPAKSP